MCVCNSLIPTSMTNCHSICSHTTPHTSPIYCTRVYIHVHVYHTYMYMYMHNAYITCLWFMDVQVCCFFSNEICGHILCPLPCVGLSLSPFSSKLFRNSHSLRQATVTHTLTAIMYMYMYVQVYTCISVFWF